MVRRKNYMDNLEVKVELIDASLLGSFRELEALQRAIHDRLKERARPRDKGDAGGAEEP